MDPIPPFQNTPPTSPQNTSPVLPSNPPKTPNYLIPILGVVLFISLAITAIFAYQNSLIQKRLDQLITVNQPSPTPTPSIDNSTTTETSPTPSTPSISPTPTSFIPSDWKTFTNQKHQASFKYPSEWQLASNSKYQITSSKGEKLIFNEDGGLMNECMKEISTSQINLVNQTFIKKTFQGIKSGQMCLGDTLGKKEIWIQPQSEKFGIQFSYLESNANEAETTFEQILSTFKFQENQTPTSPEDQFCGGFAGKPCPIGFTCVLDGSYPDAGGKCVKE